MFGHERDVTSQVMNTSILTDQNYLPKKWPCTIQAIVLQCEIPLSYSILR